MRFILILMALAACAPIETVSEFKEIRPITTDDERAKLATFQGRATAVILALRSGGQDICPQGIKRCTLDVHVGAASGLGAFAATSGVYLTLPTLAYFANDDEMALIIAHEWSHRMLGHVDADEVPTGSKRLAIEAQADCVGALLAKRAGFDAARGAAFYERLSLTAFGRWTYDPDHASAAERHKKLVGLAQAVPNPITRPDIQSACGVAP